MGVVHEALDTERGASVALKILTNVNPRSILRFKQEFRALQEVHHPNLVTLGELISEGETWFFTMELVRGRRLRLLVQRAPVAQPAGRSDHPGPRQLRARSPRPPALHRLRREAPPRRARAARHRPVRAPRRAEDPPRHQAVERPRRRSGRVVILDFGLIADLELGGDDDATEMELVGTPSYMAPEQAASKPVDAAADWYAVGVLLYEVLTGDVPFSGAPLEVLQRKQTEEPQRPSALVPGRRAGSGRPLHEPPPVRSERAPDRPAGAAHARRAPRASELASRCRRRHSRTARSSSDARPSSGS